MKAKKLYLALVGLLFFVHAALSQPLNLQKAELGHKSYGLELVSFRRLENLRTHTERFQKMGMKDLILKYDTRDGEMYFQLVWGPFSKREAKKQRKLLMDKWQLESKLVKLTEQEKARKAQKKREK